ncbi:Serine/threonine-protein kinase stk11, variant 2 [Bonamia ostreae]|uniref:non-specific serine/threonine protein kinase n=1 Tax=Bonamia ostreae TaxID=126728 RepID=A0ABV2APE6_9EUKA
MRQNDKTVSFKSQTFHSNSDKRYVKSLKLASPRSFDLSEDIFLNGTVLQNDSPKKDCLENYKIVRVLGEGTFGKVQMATCNRDGKRVAIKIVDTRRLRRIKNGTSNLEKEVFSMSKIKDKNVVELYEVLRESDGNKLYIVMELLEGGSLADLLKKEKSLNEERARMIFRQLIEGLESIHSKGIIHRDIKPSNLMLSLDAVVKIADFGISNVLKKESAMYGLIKNHFGGTPSFIPPEHFTGPEYISGFKADIWAAGITLYNMVTGSVPFNGRNLYELYQNIEKGKFSAPEYLSRELKDFIMQILNPNPNHRISISEIKKHPFL